ncbi:MAG TPA: hypothetical protein VI037_08450 [Nitrososphaera sp.]
MGLIGVSVPALFHRYHEIITGKRLKRCANALASVHVILLNIGVVAAMGLLMYTGCVGYAAVLQESAGGIV